jgi:hypothetical protein
MAGSSSLGKNSNVRASQATAFHARDLGNYSAQPDTSKRRFAPILGKSSILRQLAKVTFTCDPEAMTADVTIRTAIAHRFRAAPAWKG